MYLCLDVGNSQIHGGFFENDKLVIDFRLNTKQGWSSDQLGIFLTSFCSAHNINPAHVKRIGISSVVPSIDHHLKNAALKYFKQEPFFIKVGIKTGISVNRYQNPNEIGADLIAGAASGISLFPNTNLFIIDMGTATTIISVNATKEFLGGIIIPGVATQVASLSRDAEKLFTVDIKKPESYLGRTTAHCIQSGIYFGHLGTLRTLITNLKTEVFQGKPCITLATGGFASMYRNESIFDHLISDLILQGIIKIMKLNEV